MDRLIYTTGLFVLVCSWVCAASPQVAVRAGSGLSVVRVTIPTVETVHLVAAIGPGLEISVAGRPEDLTELKQEFQQQLRDWTVELGGDSPFVGRDSVPRLYVIGPPEIDLDPLASGIIYPQEEVTYPKGSVMDSPWPPNLMNRWHRVIRQMGHSLRLRFLVPHWYMEGRKYTDLILLRAVLASRLPGGLFDRLMRAGLIHDFTIHWASLFKTGELDLEFVLTDQGATDRLDIVDFLFRYLKNLQMDERAEDLVRESLKAELLGRLRDPNEASSAFEEMRLAGFEPEQPRRYIADYNRPMVTAVRELARLILKTSNLRANESVPEDVPALQPARIAAWNVAQSERKEEVVTLPKVRLLRPRVEVAVAHSRHKQVRLPDGTHLDLTFRNDMEVSRGSIQVRFRLDRPLLSAANAIFWLAFEKVHYSELAYFRSKGVLVDFFEGSALLVGHPAFYEDFYRFLADRLEAFVIDQTLFQQAKHFYLSQTGSQLEEGLARRAAGLSFDVFRSLASEALGESRIEMSFTGNVTRRSSETILRQIRRFSPFPGTSRGCLGHFR